jgi:hypothetical protein
MNAPLRTAGVARRLAELGAVASLACGSPPGADGDAGARLDASAVDAAAADATPSGLADLVVNPGRAQVDLALRTAEFEEGACELNPDEACIDAPGVRRLLHFSVETPNLGDADLVLGQPDPDNPNFQYSECHGHYHFEGYAEYRLLDADGGEMAAGRKQAFCLVDTERYVDDPSVSQSARYRCDSQGIQRGWSDVYGAALPCQFIDVTDVPDGAYELEIELNAERTLPEKDFENNLVSIPVDLASPDLGTPTEACPEGIDQHSSEGTHRECGWELADTFSCNPSSMVNIGCAAANGCGGTECTGDPMIRVCDGDEPDGCAFAGALSSSDDIGGSPCPCAFNVRCPESGQLRVYTGSSQLGQASECAVQLIDGPAAGARAARR